MFNNSIKHIITVAIPLLLFSLLLHGGNEISKEYKSVEKFYFTNKTQDGPVIVKFKQQSTKNNTSVNNTVSFRKRGREQKNDLFVIKKFSGTSAKFYSYTIVTKYKNELLRSFIFVYTLRGPPVS